MKMSLQHANWKYALLTAVAACLSYWIARAVGLKAGYWAAITCIVVCQSEVGATLVASRHRLIGTAIGALTGWAAVMVWHEHLAVFGVAIFLTSALCNILGMEAAGRLAGVTVAIVVLLPIRGPAWAAAGGRFIEVALGILVALAVTAVFYPKRIVTWKI